MFFEFVVRMMEIDTLRLHDTGIISIVVLSCVSETLKPGNSNIPQLFTEVKIVVVIL